MNWDQIKGKWKQAQGDAQKRWGKLTNDDLDEVKGERTRLTGKIQERYGIEREKAEEQVKEFARSCGC
jgi:uncharacterized protein YjbJ (UPF0337 family)